MASPEGGQGARPPGPYRVAFLHETAAMGGVEFSTLYLARRLDRREFLPLVVCPEEGDLLARCRACGVETAVVPWPRLLATSLVVGRRTVFNPLAVMADGVSMAAGSRQLASRLRGLDAELICTKGMFSHFYGGLAGRLAGIPVVWHLQDLLNPRRARGMYPAFLSLGAWWLADGVVTDAKAIRDQLWTKVRQAKRATVVYNGVDTQEFSPGAGRDAFRREFGLGPADLVVGTVARLTPWKGQDVFLRAAALLAPAFPQCRFLVVGAPVFDDGRYEQELRALSMELGLERQITFTGYRWDLAAALASLDVYVQPSREKDTSPLSVVSAMATGLPIVASNVPGIAEIVGPAEGRLVPPGDPAALASALREILDDEELRRRLGDGARLRAVDQLSVTGFVERCQEVFRDALTGP